MFEDVSVKVAAKVLRGAHGVRLSLGDVHCEDLDGSQPLKFAQIFKLVLRSLMKTVLANVAGQGFAAHMDSMAHEVKQGAARMLQARWRGHIGRKEARRKKTEDEQEK